MKLEESIFLTSDYTTKLQSSRQYKKERKWSRSIMSYSLWLRGLHPTRLLCPWNFPGKKYWSRLPCPPPGDLPNLGIEPVSACISCIAGRFFTHWATWKALVNILSGIWFLIFRDILSSVSISETNQCLRSAVKTLFCYESIEAKNASTI